MPLPLIPLLGLVAQFAPGLVSAIAGDKAGKVAGQVADAARSVFGTEDPDQIRAAIASNPDLALQFQLHLADIEVRLREIEKEELLARLADVAGARAQTVDLAKLNSPLAYGAAIVSGLVVVAVVVMSWIYFTVEINDTKREVASMIFGGLMGSLTTVIAYWCGSSAGSASKQAGMTAMTIAGKK